VKVKLAPSILSADFSRLGEQIAEVTKAGAEYIHLDIMDGHFVPNITIGAPVVKALRQCTKVPFDVHLMVANPESQIPLFADAGADIITVHVESCHHLHRAVEQIHKLKCKAGVSINPGSAVSMLDAIIPAVDLTLVMTVDPGYGGQPFIERMLPKIAELRRRLDEAGLSAELEVDGGINAEIAPKVVQAGATVLVAGAAVFNNPVGITKAIGQIRENIS
jgi:ribulose-phosphate 3-epimerase